jgi:hypothetical protein
MLFAFIVLEVGSIMPTVSEDSQSSLVLFVASEPSDSKVLLVKDPNGKVVDHFEWLKGLPAYREFILPPKNYRLIFPGPIKSIDVGTSSGVTTFVQYAFTTENGAQGVQITSWRGEPNATITKAISELRGFKADLEAVRLALGPEGTEIILSTDPPWPNPFDPPPSPKK